MAVVPNSTGLLNAVVAFSRAAACRFPIGGDTMSVTSGVVSRIEVTSYAHGSAELLGIQIDAAINSGTQKGCRHGSASQGVGGSMACCIAVCPHTPTYMQPSR